MLNVIDYCLWGETIYLISISNVKFNTVKTMVWSGKNILAAV